MLKFSERKQFTNEIVLVDGISRAGKFALAHVVASFERMEFLQYPYLLETLLYLHRLNKIDLETSKSLLQMDFNMKIYDMIIGRGLNAREHDLSCISKALDPAEFINRSSVEDRNRLVQEFSQKQRTPLFINHEGLANLDTLLEIAPQVKIINILRNPIALIESWYRRGMGSRIGNDPAMGWITFQHPNGPIPWWAIEWGNEYHELSEMDRCVRNIAALQDMAKKQVEIAPAEAREKILFVEFERLIEDPYFVINKISQFLGRKPMEGIEKILQRERMPRERSEKEFEIVRNQVKQQISKKQENLLEKLIDDYNGFWKQQL